MDPLRPDAPDRHVPRNPATARLQQTAPGGRDTNLRDHYGVGQRHPSWQDVLRLVDSTPLPCGMSRETVKRSDLAGHAGYGYCASHSRYFWGFRLYLISTPEGMPVI